MFIEAKNTEEAWKKAVCSIWAKGPLHVTEDGDKTKEILGLNVKILNPTLGIDKVPAEYPFHGKGLQDYIKNLMSPDRGTFEYTYGERLWAWGDTMKQIGIKNIKINQVQAAIERLSKNPLSRRAVCDLGTPAIDCFPEKIKDPPCMRIVAFNIREFKAAPMLPPIKRLNATVLFRSHDIFGASYANWIALANLMKYVAEQVSKNMGENIALGELHNYSISAHIYGRDFEAIEKMYGSLKDFI